MFMGSFYAPDNISLSGFGGRVAVIEVFGEIIDSRPITRQLEKWADERGVDAIVLHIDSPGGAVAPSQEIYDAILRVRNENNAIVVASMSSVAASGGYYIACACDEIVANPGTITGSIGVILRWYTAEKLLDKIGVEFETVKSGELKDVGSLDRPMTPEEREMLKAMVMDTYEQFVEAVADGRGMSVEDVYPLADGSIFSGRQARDKGLVDTLGGFMDAVYLAAELAGIDGEPRIVKEYQRQETIWDLMGSILGGVKKAVRGEISPGPRVLYLY